MAQGRVGLRSVLRGRDSIFNEGGALCNGTDPCIVKCAKHRLWLSFGSERILGENGAAGHLTCASAGDQIEVCRQGVVAVMAFSAFDGLGGCKQYSEAGVPPLLGLTARVGTGARCR